MERHVEKELIIELKNGEEEAEDKAQEISIRVFNNTHRFKGKSSINKYI